MAKNTLIEAVIADLRSQIKPNIAATARRWAIPRETLSKRFRGETVLNEDANSYARQQLTNGQEEVLIAYINKLNNQGFPLTP